MFLSRLVCLTLAVGVAACAPRMATVTLPAGPGRPLDPAVTRAAAEALAAPCRDLQALTADLRIAGRVDGDKVRGTLQVGVSADAVRIEGVPPFGAPVFVLAGRAEAATLIFPRDGVYVDQAPVAALTDAIVGVSVSPSDLLWLLGGCGVDAGDPLGGVGFGGDWVRLDLPDGVRAWLASSTAGAGPTLRVVETRAWRVDYDPPSEGQALRGTLRRAEAGGTQLTFVVDAPERLAALPAGALDVAIPRDARPVPVEHLRRQRALAEP
jgi:hypothetical protein